MSRETVATPHELPRGHRRLAREPTSAVRNPKANRRAFAWHGLECECRFDEVSTFSHADKPEGVCAQELFLGNAGSVVAHFEDCCSVLLAEGDIQTVRAGVSLSVPNRFASNPPDFALDYIREPPVHVVVETNPKLRPHLHSKEKVLEKPDKVKALRRTPPQ